MQFGVYALVRPHLQQFEDGGQVGLLHEAVLLGVVELVQSARRDLLRRVIIRHQKAGVQSKVQHKRAYIGAYHIHSRNPSATSFLILVIMDASV